MSKKKNHNGALEQNEKKNRRSNSALFSAADSKSVEISGYTAADGTSQTDEPMYEYSMPTGVVGIDESVILPPLSSNSHRPYYLTPSKTVRYSQTYDRKPIHLPPITRQHYPYEYFPVQPNFHHPRNLYHSYLTPNRTQSFQHNHRHRHKHGESYDPRWWYMPLNSVHGPKSYRPTEHHHYTPRKWYEIPYRQ